MEWVEPALQYLSGPIVAAVAVIYTNRRNDARESRRIIDEREERKAERAAEDRRLESERRAAVDERWRDDRRAAYARVLALTDEAVPMVREVIALVKYGGDITTGPASPEGKLDALVRQVMPQAFAEVALIASDPTQLAAHNLLLKLRVLNIRAYSTVLDPGKYLERLEAVTEESITARGEYLAALREDPGSTGLPS